MMHAIGRALGGAATSCAAVLPAMLRDVVGIIGVASISYGAWLIFVPAGYIVGGTLLVAGALLAGRGNA